MTPELVRGWCPLPICCLRSASLFHASEVFTFLLRCASLCGTLLGRRPICCSWAAAGSRGRDGSCGTHAIITWLQISPIGPFWVRSTHFTSSQPISLMFVLILCCMSHCWLHPWRWSRTFSCTRWIKIPSHQEGQPLPQFLSPIQTSTLWFHQRCYRCLKAYQEKHQSNPVRMRQSQNCQLSGQQTSSILHLFLVELNSG